MGTASFAVGTYGKVASRLVMSSTLRTSGAYSTTTSATNLEDAVGDIVLASGEILEIYVDEAMRLSFGGVPATASTGLYIPAGETRWYECNNPGTVSIIDVA
jgi:hypothetical protein